MKTIYLLLFLLPIILISSCSTATPNHAITGNVPEPTNVGINKGQIPPDFIVKTIDGKQYRLSQFKNDKPVLLYFFATWCPYCSKDFNIVSGIYPKYKDEVIFLAIDLDPNEGAELIRRYREIKNLGDADFAVADINVLSDYAIKYTTTKYAIGRDGLILYKGSGVFNEKQWEILFDALVQS